MDNFAYSNTVGIQLAKLRADLRKIGLNNDRKRQVTSGNRWMPSVDGWKTSDFFRKASEVFRYNPTYFDIYRLQTKFTYVD